MVHYNMIGNIGDNCHQNAQINNKYKSSIRDKANNNTIKFDTKFDNHGIYITKNRNNTHKYEELFRSSSK